MSSSSRKQIALIVETSLGSGREIIRGIAKYAHQIATWELRHEPRSLSDTLPEWLNNWKGDGIIARVKGPDTTQPLRELGIPVVDVLGQDQRIPFPFVHVDDQKIAHEVAAHFLDRGYQHFAFFGIEGENWSHRRGEAFETFTSEGMSFEKLETPRHQLSDFQHLRSWLRDLPRPIAIMVASDQLGLDLSEAARAEGIAIPEELALVGVDNDLPLCEISTPPLSSVRAGHFRVGYEAASLLDRILNDQKIKTRSILVPPTGVVTRASSDTVALSDPRVAAGVRFIREHLSDKITNDRIARAAGISRTLFQRNFREALGMSVRDYLIEQRLRRAEQLIVHSDLTLADIADRVGFRHQEYLGHVMKEHRGVTPASLRNNR